jgi:DNA-binding GntR family transcriptional regulator
MREKLSAQVAHRIVDHIRENGFGTGHHLAAQELADLFKVSRAPVTTALQALHQAEVVYFEANRGFFVAKPVDHLPRPGKPELAEEDALYFRIAEDRLSDRLPPRMSESELMRRYGVSRGRLQVLLAQIAQEGWVERLPGHGWEFKTTLTSGKAYEEAYQFRATLESQAVFQPRFAIDQTQLEAARRQQLALLDGEMVTLPRARLFEINSSFHETLVSWSNNAFFLDALRRVNRLRRLIEYRVTVDRSRLAQQCREHLAILEKLEAGDLPAVADFLHAHIDKAWKVKEAGVETPAD